MVLTSIDKASSPDASISLIPLASIKICNKSGFSEIYSNALLDYIMYRALSKDAEYADPNKAMGYYNAFLQTLGVKTQVDIAVTPKGK